MDYDWRGKPFRKSIENLKKSKNQSNNQARIYVKHRSKLHLKV